MSNDKPTINCPHCDGTGKMPVDGASVGEMILATRKAKSLTQDELAQKVGLSRGQVANIEVGRSDMPLRTLGRFAEALGVSMKDLVP